MVAPTPTADIPDTVPAGVDAPADVYQRLRSHLAYPKLAAAAEALPQALEDARHADASHTVFLERLLGIEVAAARTVDAAPRALLADQLVLYTTAETVLADPSVATSARYSQIDADRLLDGGNHTLYLCAPSDEQARLRPLFTSLLQTMLSAAYKRSHAWGSPLDPSLLVVLDEAANIARLRDLDTLASTAAGQGIQLVTAWQDLAQMKARYGDRAHTVINNHRATVVLSGVKDPATLDQVSRLVGDSEVTRHSTTTDATGRRSTTEGVQFAGSLRTTHCAQCPKGRARSCTAHCRQRDFGSVRGSVIECLQRSPPPQSTLTARRSGKPRAGPPGDPVLANVTLRAALRSPAPRAWF